MVGVDKKGRQTRATVVCVLTCTAGWLPRVPRVQQQQLLKRRRLQRFELAIAAAEEVLLVLVGVVELLKFIYEMANKPPPIVWNLRRPDNI